MACGHAWADKLTSQVLEQTPVTDSSPALTNFLESLPSADSKDGYLRSLKKFMKFLRVDDPELLLKWDNKVIEDQIVSFVVSLRHAGAAQLSIRQYYTGIKHFYEINDVVLNWKKLKIFVGKSKAKRTNDRPYEHKEISKLLEYSTPRTKVIILLMCSAGLRVGGLTSLSVGDLSKIEKYNIYQITVTNNKGRPPYITFCSPECAAAIDTYLQFRKERLGEIVTEVSPVISNLTNKEHNYRETSPGTRMTVVNIKQAVWRLLKDAGFRRPDNAKKILGQRHSTALCHSMRKFMRTQLKNAGVDHLHAETLIGHSTGLVGVYTKIEEEELLEAYTKAIPHLTINNEEREKLKVKELTAARERDRLTFEQKFEEYQSTMNAKFDAINKEIAAARQK
jgi:site-specific recombinase XerD